MMNDYLRVDVALVSITVLEVSSSESLALFFLFPSMEDLWPILGNVVVVNDVLSSTFGGYHSNVYCYDRIHHLNNIDAVICFRESILHC